MSGSCMVQEYEYVGKIPLKSVYIYIYILA